MGKAYQGHGLKLQKEVLEGLPPCCLAEGNCLYDIFGFLRTTCSISSTKLPQTSPLLLPLVAKHKEKKHWPQHDSLDLNCMSMVFFQPDKDS